MREDIPSAGQDPPLEHLAKAGQLHSWPVHGIIISDLQDVGDPTGMAKRGQRASPVVVQLHGAGVDVGFQVIIAVRQRRHPVQQGGAAPHALQLQQQNCPSEGLKQDPSQGACCLMEREQLGRVSVT